MEAGKGKSRDFGLSQALANQVVQKGVCGDSFYAAFRPLFRRVGRWCTGIRFETKPSTAMDPSSCCSRALG